MKTTNAVAGIDLVVADAVKRTWYRYYRFPVLPLLDIREADEWNSWAFAFSWLFLRVWNLDSVSLALRIELSGGGLIVQLIVPYMSIVVHLLYFPQRLESWVMGHLWRKGLGGKT